MYNLGLGFAGILAFIPNPIISTNEAWFLSNTEKVHALFSKINEIIEKVNTYEELFGELKDILADFDDTVKTEVEKYIKEMYENGELRDIINELVNNEIIAELRKQVISANELPLQRYESRFYDSGMYQLRYESNAGGTPVTRYPVIQGGCTFVKNGIRYFLGSFVSQNEVTNQVMLRLYRAGTYEPIWQYAQNLGHCNGLSYDIENDYLYAVHSSEYTTSQLEGPENYPITKQRVSTNKISRLKLSWNDSLGTVINDGNFETIIVNIHPYDINVYNNTIYTFLYNGSNVGMGTLDWDSATITQTHNFTDLRTLGTRASFTVNDKYIIIGTFSPNNIYVLDKENTHPTLDSGLIQILRPPLTIENVDAFGELEWCHLEDNGDLFLGSFTEGQGASRSEFMNFNISLTNIYKGISRNVEQVSKNAYSRAVYVVIKSTNDTAYANKLLHSNGTKDYPYPTVQHAINSIENDEKLKTADIRVYADIGSNYSIIVKGSKHIEIIQYTDETFETTADSGNDPLINNDIKNSIGGVFCDGGNKLSLRCCYVYQRHSVFSGTNYGVINSANTDLSIRNCRTSDALIRELNPHLDSNNNVIYGGTPVDGEYLGRAVTFINAIFLYRNDIHSVASFGTHQFSAYSPSLRIDGSQHLS